jgi:hypothetical protein
VNRVLCCLALLLCIFAGASHAQEPKQSVIFDASVIDLDPGNTASIEALVKDKAGLDRLIAEGKARIEANLQVRSRVNEQANVRTGQRVPVQIGALTIPAPPSHPNEGSALISGFGMPQIQYQNAGLNLDIAPLKVTGSQCWDADSLLRDSDPKQHFSSAGRRAHCLGSRSPIGAAAGSARSGLGRTFTVQLCRPAYRQAVQLARAKLSNRAAGWAASLRVPVAARSSIHKCAESSNMDRSQDRPFP